MCGKYPVLLSPKVAKAVKADSAFHPNQSGYSRDTRRRSTSIRILLLSTFGRGGDSAVRVLSPRVQ
jgi:hypothetical protein